MSSPDLSGRVVTKGGMSYVADTADEALNFVANVSEAKLVVAPTLVTGPASIGPRATGFAGPED